MNKKLKTVMKFDSGADGFKAMCFVLAIMAVIVLICGIVFLMMTFK